MLTKHTYTDERRVISVSRRTDVPTFYSRWFMNRIEAGVVAVPNPNNANQVSWVSLRPESVVAFVFWTKDAKPMLKHLDRLDEMGYTYYFQYTVTAFGSPLERNTPSLEASAKTFRELSRRLGKSRVVWRYDPILFTPGLDDQAQLKHIAEVAEALDGATDRLVISFLDVYRRTAANLKRCLGGESVGPFPTDWELFSSELGRIAARHGLHIQTCAEGTSMDDGNGHRVNVLQRMKDSGAVPGRCIDHLLLEELLGETVDSRKDTGQREGCGCVRSRDIGMYDSCLHGCAYCYANISDDVATRKARADHHDDSATLLGRMDDGLCPKDLQLF